METCEVRRWPLNEGSKTEERPSGRVGLRLAKHATTHLRAAAEGYVAPQPDTGQANGRLLVWMASM
jgi:hypothetical protein